ncbi:MAG: hypothetical protein A4E40_01549 [Methanoregulaceae archaeon PtaU1.Bin059]|nr:MAG: hypothetical protein A4E40_01549 [Methanoregulaceae archaeon PtaU1.Bin059]
MDICTRNAGVQETPLDGKIRIIGDIQEFDLVIWLYRKDIGVLCIQGYRLLNREPHRNLYDLGAGKTLFVEVVLYLEVVLHL